MGGSRARPPALALAIAVAGPAAADVEVSWDAPASCPDAEAARAEILARVADRPAARRLRAAARVRALSDGAWQVDVELHGDDGTAVRTLRAESCEEALTATAVVVAIAVDPALEATPVERGAREVGVPPPPGSGPGTAVVDPEVGGSSRGVAIEGSGAGETVGDETNAVAPPTDPVGGATSGGASREGAEAPGALGLSLGVRGGLDFGALPSPAGHVAGAVGLHGRRFVVQAGALHRIRTDAFVGPPGSVGGRFRLTAAQLLAGPRLRWGALELPLAAGLELGAIWARGIGEVEPITVRRPWVAALASVGIGWAPLEARGRRGGRSAARDRPAAGELRRASFALHLGIDGVVPLLRPAFTLDELEVLTVGPVAMRAWLGVVGRFSL